MPINIPDRLPAVELLKKENIFVMGAMRALKQDIRALRLALLNLMPLKIDTETDLVRVLSNSPLQVELDLIGLKSHTSKNTPIEHIREFYIDFDEIKDQKYDGIIVTGAPLGHLNFEDVTYWEELTRILDWAKTHVTASMFICWSAQAALYHYYGIKKYPLEKKMFGIFEHTLNAPLNPLFRGFDDVFYAPHSRHTEIKKEDIEKMPGLDILSESGEAGIYIVSAREGREIFITGHAEYAPETLDSEYKRDLAKKLPIEVPRNYYKDNNPDNPPLVRWRSHANLLFQNWLNYFVYQITPYHIGTIAEIPAEKRELDDNDIPFISINGGIDLGTIRAETGLTEAPIRLSEGVEYSNGKGYGIAHIEKEHGVQIRNAGYSSIEEFVAKIASSYTTIRRGNERGEHETYLLEVTDEHNNTLFVELSSNDGSYWNVNSAGIFRVGVNHGTSKGATVTSGNSPQIGSKGSENNSNAKQEEANTEDTATPPAEERTIGAEGAAGITAQDAERLIAANGQAY
jgi:homoserine O-succinyltransferase